MTGKHSKYESESEDLKRRNEQESKQIAFVYSVVVEGADCGRGSKERKQI